MKMLLTEKTEQEKIINEVQKKRNLFGLGLTSLIAACGATDSATDSATDNTDNTDKDKDKDNTPEIDTRPETDLQPTKLTATTATVATATIASNSAGGATERIDPAIKDLQVTVTPEQGGFSGAENLVLRIANGNHRPEHIFASVYTGLTATDKHDLVVSSYLFGDVAGTDAGKTGAVYIFWDIGNIAPDAIPANDAADTLALKHLKIEGSEDFEDPAVNNYNLILSSAPKFYHIGGIKDAEDNNQYDIVFQSFASYNILWDVTQHATKEGETTVTLGTSPGILQVQGVGTAQSSFIKVNNNDNYDMIITSSSNTYIVWDVANYYDANVTNTISVNLADPSTATHSLLTIANADLTSAIKKDTDKGGFTDIDGGGTNDLAFVYDSNTYILFGEKVANIDEESGKAISHTVDFITVISEGKFFDKDGVEVTEFADSATAIEGFFHYDLDGNNVIDDVEKNVGYSFSGETGLGSLEAIKTAYEAVINPPAAGGALSEEAYWDIA